MNLFLKMISKITLTILTITYIFIPEIVYATTQSGNSSHLKFPILGVLISWIICYRTKKKEIGGWLLYYYIQLYSGIGFLVLITLQTYDNYLPHSWHDNSLYALYLLTKIPIDILYLMEAIIASFILNSRLRSKRIVNYLLGIFVFQFVFISIELIVNLVQWDNATIFNYTSLLLPVIWFLYFFKSKRVHQVFIKHRWKDPKQNVIILQTEFINNSFYRKKARIYIWICVGTIFLWALFAQYSEYFRNIIIPILPILAFASFSLGMGWFSISKGYSRGTGLVLSIFSWIGLIVIYVLEDKTNLYVREDENMIIIEKENNTDQVILYKNQGENNVNSHLIIHRKFIEDKLSSLQSIDNNLLQKLNLIYKKEKYYILNEMNNLFESSKDRDTLKNFSKYNFNEILAIGQFCNLFSTSQVLVYRTLLDETLLIFNNKNLAHIENIGF